MLAAQVRYIGTQVAAFQAAGDPMISVDTKKESAATTPMAGRSGSAGAPQRVNVHEFAWKELVAEVPVEDLRYKMIMALNAADIGNPICEQAAQICAEIAEQYCAQLHVTTTAQVIAAGQRAASQALPSRA